MIKKLFQLNCRKCGKNFHIEATYRIDDSLKYGKNYALNSYQIISEQCNCDKSYIDESYFQNRIPRF